MARTLADLVAEAAPMPGRRAAAVMVAVGRAVERLEAAGATPVGVQAESVRLHEDGSVEFTVERTAIAPEDPSDWVRPGTEAAASLGRLYFELLVGRAPLDRSEAFEPVITASLAPPGCALLARSIADAPAQWPTATQWCDHFECAAGGLAPPVTPAERRRARRRRLAVVAAVALLVVATVLVVLVAAPRWWDAATTEERSASPVQRPRDSS